MYTENGTPMTQVKTKTDCFAYDKDRDICKALKRLYCQKEKCGFYKTRKNPVK